MTIQGLDLAYDNLEYQADSKSSQEKVGSRAGVCLIYARVRKSL